LNLIRPGFDTLNVAIDDKIEDWNQIFLHVLEELRQKGVELEQREMLLQAHATGRPAPCSIDARWAKSVLLSTIRESTAGTVSASNSPTTIASSSTTTPSAMRLATSCSARRAASSGCIAATDIGVRWGGDEYFRVVRNLVSDSQLGLIAGRDAEIVDSYDWEALDARFKDCRPCLSIGLVYCECPSAAERARMLELDKEVELTPAQHFDLSVAVPEGIVVRCGAPAGRVRRRENVRSQTHVRRKSEPHVLQTNVRILNGALIET